MTTEFTHQELVYVVKGKSAFDIDRKARLIAENFFGMKVDLQAKVVPNPNASEWPDLPYQAKVIAREKK